MNNKAKRSRAAAGGVIAMAAGLIAATLLVSELAASTPDSTAVEGHQPASVHHYTGPRTADAAEGWLTPWNDYTGPTTPDAAEHWIRWQKRDEARTVRDYANRILSDQLSMQGLERLAVTNVAHGDWTPDLVNRIVKLVRIKKVAALYFSIERRHGPLSVQTR